MILSLAPQVGVPAYANWKYCASAVLAADQLLHHVELLRHCISCCEYDGCCMDVPAAQHVLYTCVCG
jgi:hypothetical protein